MLLGRKAIGTVAYMGGVPAVLEKFCWSWGQMVQYNQEMLCGPDQFVHYDRATISDHAPARNHLTSRFLGDWLLQLDTDHEFDPDIVARLVRLADVNDIDVLSGFYQFKNGPCGPVLFQWVGDDPDRQALHPMIEWPGDVPLLQVGSAGAGCLLVRRSVFDRIAREWPGSGAFDRIPPFSEDHSFFVRCKKLGIACYAAMHVRSDHLRVQPVTPDQFDSSGLTSANIEVGGLK